MNQLRALPVLSILLFFVPGCTQAPVKTVESLRQSISHHSYIADKYRLYSVKAYEEGYKNVANLFEAISHAERIQAERQMKILEKYRVPVSMLCDSTPLAATLDNLRSAAAAQLQAGRVFFPEMMETASREGQTYTTRLFTFAASSSMRYSRLLLYAATSLEADGSDRSVINSWSVCPHCGHVEATAGLSDLCRSCRTPSCEFLLFQK